MSEARYLYINGKRFDYTLTRKSVKNITVRVRVSGEVAVTAPTKTTLRRIEEVLQSHIDAIEASKGRMAKKRAARPQPLQLTDGESITLFGKPYVIRVVQGEKRMAGLVGDTLFLSVKSPTDAAERYRCFTEFTDRSIRAYFADAVARALPHFLPKPPKMPLLCYRTMKTRWGVCNYNKQKITFNRKLIFFPPDLIDYVVYHELAHFHHPDHSRDFWQLLTAKMPDCRERRRALNNYPVPPLAAESE